MSFTKGRILLRETVSGNIAVERIRHNPGDFIADRIEVLSRDEVEELARFLCEYLGIEFDSGGKE